MNTGEIQRRKVWVHCRQVHHSLGRDQAYQRLAAAKAVPMACRCPRQGPHSPPMKDRYRFRLDLCRSQTSPRRQHHLAAMHGACVLLMLKCRLSIGGDGYSNTNTHRNYLYHMRSLIPPPPHRRENQSWATVNFEDLPASLHAR